MSGQFVTTPSYDSSGNLNCNIVSGQTVAVTTSVVVSGIVFPSGIQLASGTTVNLYPGNSVGIVGVVPVTAAISGTPTVNVISGNTYIAPNQAIGISGVGPIQLATGTVVGLAPGAQVNLTGTSVVTLNSNSQVAVTGMPTVIVISGNTYIAPNQYVSITATQRSYCASMLDVTPVAGDSFYLLANNIGVKVALNRVVLTMVGLNTASIDVSVIRRTSLNTGGTSNNLSAYAMDTNDTIVPAQAVAGYYSVPPTASGVFNGNLYTSKYTIVQAGLSFLPEVLDTTFFTNFSKPPSIGANNAGYGFYITFGVVPTGASLNVSMYWTEI